MSDFIDPATEYISISDLDSPPVITLCPRQEYDSKLLGEWGYSSSLFYATGDITDLLRGNDNN